jgi:hypothetical protein
VARASRSPLLSFYRTLRTQSFIFSVREKDVIVSTKLNKTDKVTIKYRDMP